MSKCAQGITAISSKSVISKVFSISKKIESERSPNNNMNYIECSLVWASPHTKIQLFANLQETDVHRHLK